MSPDSPHFAADAVGLRSSAKLTVKEAAERADVCTSTWRDWENEVAPMPEHHKKLFEARTVIKWLRSGNSHLSLQLAVELARQAVRDLEAYVQGVETQLQETRELKNLMETVDTLEAQLKEKKGEIQSAFWPGT